MSASMRAATESLSALAAMRRAGRRPGGLLPYGMVSPVVLLLLGIIVLPELWALVLSFQHYTFGQARTWAGGANYAKLAADPAFWNALRNNLLFVGLVVALEFGVGLGMAVLLARGFPLQRVWVALFLAPYAVSPVVGVITWKYMLEPDVGIINYALARVGLGSLHWFTSPALAFTAVVLIEVWRSAPFVAMVCYPAILSLPADYFDAAKVDGATAWQTFARVTFPLIRPAVVVAIVFRIIFAFRTFDTIWILTKGGPVGATEVLAIYLYQQGFRYWEFGGAAATAWVMLAVTCLLAAYYLRGMRRSLLGAREAA